LILLLGMLPGCGSKAERTTSFGADKVGSTVNRIDLGSKHKFLGLIPPSSILEGLDIQRPDF